MIPYFDTEKTTSVTGDSKQIIKKIADRYIEANQAEEYTYRAYNTNGFMRDNTGRCILDFDSKFPMSKNGDYAYAVSKIYCEKDGKASLSFTCHNPMWIYVNGEEVTRTNCRDEVFYDERTFEFDVKQGCNVVFIKCRKNTLGFCCIIGSCRPKWQPVNFYTVFNENKGELGWNYCGTFKEDTVAVIKDDNKEMPKMWLPKIENACISIKKGGYAVSFAKCDGSKVTFNGECNSKWKLYIDGEKMAEGLGNIVASAKPLQGIHSVSVWVEDDLNINEITADGAQMFLPQYIEGTKGKWLSIDTDDAFAEMGFDPYHLYKNGNGYEYFRCSENRYIRPILEKKLFGKSNYPIGVVLYGLMTAARYIGDKEISEYAHRHIMQCCKIQKLAKWECEKFGFACVNHQMLELSALDDCGSFAFAVLEDYFNSEPSPEEAEWADYVGEYIQKKQERLENGAFYRKMENHFFRNTVWADDLYMSTPFLMRYSKLKNESKLLDDAVNQFLCYKEMLYMEDKKLMSHVYNTKLCKMTAVPWGRGNGWVIFSLSELLSVLSKQHSKYKELEGLFVQLCEGFLNVIDKDGMCHQVLTDPLSYAECSSTAMCAAAFARGVRLGILNTQYAAAAKKCIEAIEKMCVDDDGNIYGVCCGSGYSFREEYYKNELPWIKNDTHGTGIVLIAITETDLLKKGHNI